MKIGIITFHRASNYGAVLQCYALTQFLSKKGYQVEVVDYRSHSIESTYKLVLFDSFRNFISSLIHILYRYKSNANFRKFINSFLPISKRSYYAASEIKGYDILIIGSDQVWNKRITKGFDNVYWGEIPYGKAIISYAASMGTEVVYLEEDKIKIQNYLRNFDSISVREQSLHNFIGTLTNKPIKIVLDPAFLLSKNDYMDISCNPSITKYVLYYQMEYNRDAKKRVCEIANQLGCQVVVLGGKKEKYPLKYKYLDSSNVSVPEFLGYINNAECVMASTFHGVVFSLIFNKDFYFIANGKTDRATFLLHNIGATNRIVSPKNSLIFSKVNYQRIRQNIDVQKDLSIEFLINAIKKFD